MKVYGMTLNASLIDRGNLQDEFSATRQIRAIIATTSQRKAAEAFGVSLYDFRNYGSQTWNDCEVATATSRPGVVFMRALDDHNGEYVRR